MSRQIIDVNGIAISLLKDEEGDYICLSDLARNYSEPRTLIANWMRSRNTIEFLGTWEELNNPTFEISAFNQFLSDAGGNVFTMTPSKWISQTEAIGMVHKTGRDGGTYAHQDIALGFCYYLSPKFQLYFIREFQRLKEEEARVNQLEWDVHRIMTKANHRIYTEAIRTHLIPPRIQNTRQEGIIFANEADMLNIALFGMTAKQWRTENPKAKGNIRDNVNAEQLLVLSNLQSLNAKLMEWGCDADQRLDILNSTAIDQMKVLVNSSSLKKLAANPELDAGPEQKLLD